ncbi:RNA-splicing factor [Lignoscripta atroalba]|nr:RNA-splicing factor [Lignoscripta atroalba]
MGGDLNLKKSWHPVLMSNQRRVWEEEKKALDERKRIDQMMKERQEERQIQELQEMQEAAGGKKRLNRVDWMYSGPSSGQTGTTEEMEGYLLGKRRIDGLIKGTENKKLEKAASQESFMALQHANTLKDTASKIREDPMLAIKKQEQAAYEAMMNDPVRRRLLLKAAGRDVEDKEKEKQRKHRKHRDHDDHDSRRHRHRGDRDGNYKRRRTEEEDRYSRNGRHHQRRSHSSSYSRSPPQYNRRSPSLYYREKESYQSHRRSRSPESRSPSPYRRRSPSPYYQGRKSAHSQRRSRSLSREQMDHHRLKQSKSWSSVLQRPTVSTDQKQALAPATDDRAAKLAAMQQAASELDQDRERRIAAVSEREEADRRADDAARARSAKHGGKGDFVNGLNRKAGDIDIGDRIRRGRGGLEKEREEY